MKMIADDIWYQLDTNIWSNLIYIQLNLHDDIYFRVYDTSVELTRQLETQLDFPIRRAGQ